MGKKKLYKDGGDYIDTDGIRYIEVLHIGYCRSCFQAGCRGVVRTGYHGPNYCFDCVEITEEQIDLSPDTATHIKVVAPKHWNCVECGISVSEADRHVHEGRTKCHDCSEDFGRSDAESDAAAMRLAVCLHERRMLKKQVDAAEEYLKEIRDREHATMAMLRHIAQNALTKMKRIECWAAEDKDNDTD